MRPPPFVGALASFAMAMSDKPYGTWESPITSQSITAGSVGIGNLKVVSSLANSDENTLYWTEMRPKEGGRYVLCQYATFATTKNERNAVDVSPQDANVRTRVHEYGGGAVVTGAGDGAIFYSEFATQRLHKLSVLVEGDKPSILSSTPITPADKPYRFADGVCSAQHGKVYCVREDHTNPAPKDVKNEIVSVPAMPSDNDDDNIQVLAMGNDFFAAPRLSPDGMKLAYITWNHPSMPWDATQLKVIELASGEEACQDPQTSAHTLIAGADEDTSVLQPLWHPLTGDLYYISDESGFYNIYRARLQEGTDASSVVNVLPMDYDFGGSAPGWSLGQQGFTFLKDGRLVATYTKNGQSVLVVANVMDSKDGPARDVEEYGMKHGLPRQFGGVVSGTTKTNFLYFLGGSPSTPTSVYQWNLDQPGEPAEVLACSSNVSFPDTVISTPQQISFPTTNGNSAYGYYYPPTNQPFTCTTEKAPPLLVKAHGGPTACTSTTFNAGIQYWTSRGFAILDVDYGGSTGYGREYRRRLRKSWGIVDIEDVCAGAQHLVQEGKADPDRLCIDGGSAGGYTTLGALAFKDVFKAGCSLYGVGDLTALAGDTHKFESRYLDGLVGPYPQDEEIYKKRSPISNVDSLSCPILLLQGDEDKIVPPNQAELMHQALLKKGIPTCLKIYKGEQHGFRKAENIEDALDSELAFFGRVFGFKPHNGIDIKIDNIK